MVNKNLQISFAFWIMISLVFIIPLNSGGVYAESIQNQQAQSTVCGNSLNVKSSIILSILTLCLPGILEKAYQYKQIKCEAAQCYYNSIKNGLDPAFCNQHQAYKTCTMIVGEAFSIPPMSILEYWRNAIANVLANPVGLLWAFGVKEARTIVSASCINTGGTITCTAANPYYYAATIAVTVTDAMAIVQQIKDIMENGFFPPLNPANACEGLDEIKEEMDQILKAK